MAKLAAGKQYDVMENHAEKFTQPKKEFQPRVTIKKDSNSKLKDSSNYQAPRRRRSSQQTSRKESVDSLSKTKQHQENQQLLSDNDGGEVESVDFDRSFRESQQKLIG
jgi:hypothetical protein